VTLTSPTQWCVANTHVNAETAAAAHLQRQGFTVYLPLYSKLRTHARRSEWVSRPLFPRYLFVGVSEINRRWRAINSTIGISHLVSFGGQPAPVSDDLISDLRAREDETGMVRLAAASPFRKGEAVTFLSGALCDHAGIFECIDDKDRVVVLLDLLGRKIKVRAPIETVQACA